MKNKKGFTLIELLAVIAILAILVIIAVPTVLQLFQDAKQNTFRTQAQSIFKTAQQQYMSDSIGGSTPTGYCQDGDETSGILDTSGNQTLNYEIVFTYDAISAFSITDGTYSITLTIDSGYEIDAISSIALGSDITISCED